MKEAKEYLVKLETIVPNLKVGTEKNRLQWISWDNPTKTNVDKLVEVKTSELFEYLLTLKDVSSDVIVGNSVYLPDEIKDKLELAGRLNNEGIKCTAYKITPLIRELHRLLESTKNSKDKVIKRKQLINALS